MMGMKAVHTGGKKVGTSKKELEEIEERSEAPEDDVVMVLFPAETWREVLRMAKVTGSSSTEVIATALEFLSDKVKEKQDGTGSG